MNAATLLAMTTARPQVSNSGKETTNLKTENQSSSFTQVLDTVINETVDTVKLITGDKSLTIIDEVEGTINPMNWDEMIVAFEQLFESLALDEGFIDPELLKDADLLALLNVMPQSMSQSLTDFLKTGYSFEQLIAQTKTGSNEQLGLLLLTVYQLEKKNQFPEQLKQFDFVKVLQQRFNEQLNTPNPVQAINASMLVKELVQVFESKHKAEILNAKSFETELLNHQNKDILRPIIQRVLYSNPNPNEDMPFNNQKGQTETLLNTNQNQAIQSNSVDVFDQILNSSIKDGSISRIQQHVLTVQQPGSSSSLPEDQILNQLKNIMSQSKLTTSANGTNQLLIKLNPAHLGSLTIKLSETNGEMIARIIASSATAKEVIETNLQSLRHVFTTQNINVEKFDIQYQGEQQFKDSDKESNQQEESSKRNQEEPQTKDMDDTTESTSFEELFNMMV